MPCLAPLPATQDEDGSVTLRQSLLEAKMEDGQYLELPCGRCGTCRSKRVRSWAIRSHHEAQMATRIHKGVEVSNGCFITLTYDDWNLPPDGSLDVKHWQNFAKKLRRTLGPFRFLHCGEYGPKTHRPHYHACIFGLDFHEDRVLWQQADGRTTWLSDTLSQVWGKGFTTLAPLNFATASYVAGYVFKKLKTADHLAEHSVYGESPEPLFTEKPEYVTMSRNPGLGTPWLDRYWRDVYPADLVNIDGKTYRPPPFYDNYLLERDPPLYDQVMAKRREWLDEQPPTCKQQLKARRANHEARMALGHKRDKTE